MIQRRKNASTPRFTLARHDSPAHIKSLARPAADGLTFLQLIQGRNLVHAIDGKDEADPLRQVDVIRQRAREVSQQRVEGAESVIGHSVHDALEVAVAVAVEAHLFGFLLAGEGLQRARTVEAAVGAVGRAGKSVHTPAPRGTSRLVSLIKMAKV